MELYLDEQFKENIEQPKVPAIERLNYQRFKLCNFDNKINNYTHSLNKSKNINIPIKKEKYNFTHLISPQDYESLLNFVNNKDINSQNK